MEKENSHQSISLVGLVEEKYEEKYFCFTLLLTLHVLGKALDGGNLLFVNYFKIFI